MGTGATVSAGSRRARRSFWVLLVVAVLACGSLSAALAAPAGPVAGLRVAGSGVVLLVAIALLTRLLVAADRSRRTGSAGPPARRRAG